MKRTLTGSAGSNPVVSAITLKRESFKGESIYKTNKEIVLGIEVVSYSKSKHLKALSSLTLSAYQTGELYPPRQDVKDEIKNHELWWENDETVKRFIILFENEVVGHIAFSNPHPYLVKQLNLANLEENDYFEVGKFFISKPYRKHGLGHTLLKVAEAEALMLNKKLALAVISTSTAAIKFYEEEKFNNINSFEGIHGLNHIYVK